MDRRYPGVMVLAALLVGNALAGCHRCGYSSCENYGGPNLVNTSTQLTLKYLLQGVAWLFFAIAFVLFWYGGRGQSTNLPKTERILSEAEGSGLAIVCTGLGTIGKAGANRFGEHAKDGTL